MVSSSLQSETCFIERIHDRFYSSEDFLARYKPWLDAGAPFNNEFEKLKSSESFTHDKSEIILIANSIFDAAPTCMVAMLGATFVMNMFWTDPDHNPPVIPFQVFFHLPWSYFARSTWNIFSLAFAYARSCALLFADLRDITCEVNDLVFWRDDAVVLAGTALEQALQNPKFSVPSFQIAATVLLEHAHVSTWPYDLQFRVGWGLLVLVLSLLSPDAVTPGYALYHMQECVLPPITQEMVTELSTMSMSKLKNGLHWPKQEMSDMEKGFHCLGKSAWPLLPLVSHLCLLENLRRPNLDHTTTTSSDLVALDDIDSQLLKTLRVADAFLAAAGIEYFAIAGTLLGSLRHFGRIPWDDDADICVDYEVEAKLLSITIALEAERLGLAYPKGMSAAALRGLQHLQKERHVLKADNSKAVTFQLMPADVKHNRIAVDIWFYYGQADHTVSLMSGSWGPRVPWRLIEPRQKLPFGSMTIWSPSDAVGVTQQYLRHGGLSDNFFEVCGGMKSHTDAGTSESDAFVPCDTLKSRFQFAGNWTELDTVDERNAVWNVLQDIIKRRLLALSLPSVNELLIHTASYGVDEPPRLRASFFSNPDAGGPSLSCDAWLWRGSADDALIYTWALLDGSLVLRSLVCTDTVAEEVKFVLEDAYK